MLTFLAIIGGLTLLVLIVLAIWALVHFLARLILSIIMVRQWRREETNNG